MNAFGAKCSIGDQLHPNGKLDLSTYELIGAAYSEVAAREPWCKNSVPVTDIALLSSEAENGHDGKNKDADTGASRILLEGHHLFTLIDRLASFEDYKLLILPDNILVDDALKTKIDAYLAQGGKLLLTGRSGLRKAGDGFAFDIGAEHLGESPFEPDYILPTPAHRASFVNTPAVMYVRSERIKATTGESLGQIFDPYFNRTFEHFCSHRHTPYRPEPSGFDAGVRNGNITYLAHAVFSLYRGFGAIVHKDYTLRIIDALLGDAQTVTTNLPSTARLTLRRQPREKRQIVHLMYANKALRGGTASLWAGAASPVEVIEELDPLIHITAAIRTRAKITRVTLEPQGQEIAYSLRDGKIEIAIGEFTCHQMVVLHEA